MPSEIGRTAKEMVIDEKALEAGVEAAMRIGIYSRLRAAAAAQEIIIAYEAAKPVAGVVSHETGDGDTQVALCSTGGAQPVAPMSTRGEMVEQVLKLLDSESDDKTLTVWRVAAKSFAQRIRALAAQAIAPGATAEAAT